MLKNANGNILEVENEVNGNVQLAVYKSLTDRTSYLKKPSQATAPDRVNINVSGQLASLSIADLALTSTEINSLSLKQITFLLAQKAILLQVKESPKSMPRTKFENLNFTIV